MKPRNARLLDDLLCGTNSTAVYKHVRDGHVSDLSEILGGLERLLPYESAIQALVILAYLLIQTRGAYGSEETRKRDGQAARLRTERSSPGAPHHDRPKR